MENAEEAGRVLQDKAEKKLQKWFSFGGNKWEEAQELFSQAATKYKLAKSWKAAGLALLRVHDCARKQDSKYDAATACTEAAQCFKKAEDSANAALALTTAIEIYIDMGRFTNAAKCEKELGELFQGDLQLDKAIAHFRKAAEYYNAEDQGSNLNNCLTSVADLLTQLDRYDEAVETYEKIAKSVSGNKLLQYQAKGYLFKAMLCTLLTAMRGQTAEGLLPAEEKLRLYTTLDPYFTTGREYELLTAIIDALQKADVAAFEAAVSSFDGIQRLDDWKTTTLLSIKRAMMGTGGSSGEEADLR